MFGKEAASHTIFKFSLVLITCLSLFTMSCNGNDEEDEVQTSKETDYTDLLTNQVNEIIIPSMTTYRDEMADLVTAVNGFVASVDATNLNTVKTAYQEAYLAYQAAAVHNYYATVNQDLVNTSNLYPVDTALLSNLIASESYNFNNTAQQRANGFPALDFMLYGPDDVVDYFTEDSKRLDFIEALVDAMKVKADALVAQWTGNLKTNFINNGGTALGSSISVQLNETLVYYEEHIRGSKVGIPIGRYGPNDTPFEADATKIEAYFQSLHEGNDNFTLALLTASIEEMEDMYLGETSTNDNGQGYDDLLIARGKNSIDEDIKATFETIYTTITNRSTISGDETLYNAVQSLVTLYKSDLLPVLNVQDADGANDGD